MAEMAQRRGTMMDGGTNTDSEEPPSPTEPLGGANAPYTPTITKVKSVGITAKSEEEGPSTSVNV